MSWYGSHHAKRPRPMPTLRLDSYPHVLPPHMVCHRVGSSGGRSGPVLVTDSDCLRSRGVGHGLVVADPSPGSCVPRLSQDVASETVTAQCPTCHRIVNTYVPKGISPSEIAAPVLRVHKRFNPGRWHEPSTTVRCEGSLTVAIAPIAEQPPKPSRCKICGSQLPHGDHADVCAQCDLEISGATR